MFGFRNPRRFRAVQVEVTSRCTRSCRVCPRSTLSKHWLHGDLESSNWARLSHSLELADHVHLQGWGEPLLHSDIALMTRDAHSAGCTVGITTNGDLLDDATEWIVREGVEQVALSLGGDTAEHAELRDNSSLSSLWKTTERLKKARGRSRKPKVQVSYLLTRSNAETLPSVLRKASRVGVDELYVIHLDCTLSSEILKLAAFSSSGLRPSVAQALKEAATVARRARIAFRPPALHTDELLACALDPRRFLFVGWDGRVGPCVNLLLPISSSIPRYTSKGCIEITPRCFGRLSDRALPDILEGSEFHTFTAPFIARFEANQRFLAEADGGYGTTALKRIDAADDRLSKSLEKNPFPKDCQGCHKQSGW